MLLRFYKGNILFIKRYLLVSILLVLSGCQVIGTSSPSKPTAEKTSSRPTGVQLIPDSSSVSFQIENLLHVYGSTGISCKPTIGFGKTVVLATDRLTYDQAEVNQISAFIDSQGYIDKDVGHIDGPSIPKTLKYITGSASTNMFDRFGRTGEGPRGNYTSCGTILEVTNISKETLHIPQIHLRYLRNTEPNTQLYRLINICSIGIRTQKMCPPQVGGPGYGYGTVFTIGMGPTNTTYSSKVDLNNPMDAGSAPSIPTLRPGDVALITIDFYVQTYESGLFGSAIPEMVVTSPDKTQTVALTQFKMDIAIAASQNVSCYALKGNAFVQQDPAIGQCV
jgi:hypothetical protein